MAAEDKGKIFDIQRYSVHDGPGIRTTVFLKGCPLDCTWCSNPESKNIQPNLMLKDRKCVLCGSCVEACPKNAIEITNGERIIDWEACDECLKCAEACIHDSITVSGRRTTVGDILKTVMKDKDFYDESGGGITVSGGEPLYQHKFATRLLKESKQKGLHTAMDTTGYTSWEKVKKAVEFVDLLLWDIKNLDSQKHRNTTGVGNELILENLKRVARTTSVRIWLRVPLIAGFNDSEKHIQNIAELGKEINAEKISLLPYHEGGKSKCNMMNIRYPWPDAKAPTDEHIKNLKNIIEGEELKVSIGN